MSKIKKLTQEEINEAYKRSYGRFKGMPALQELHFIRELDGIYIREIGFEGFEKNKEEIIRYTNEIIRKIHRKGLKNKMESK